MEIGNALNWFEIPVSDFARAKKFYEALFNFEMPEMEMGPAKMGFLPHDMPGGKVGGAIVHSPELYTPSDNGTLVYLNCQPDLQVVLDKVAAAGGNVLQEKTLIADEMGFYALIKDSEGNRVGLHSMG